MKLNKPVEEMTREELRWEKYHALWRRGAAINEWMRILRTIKALAKLETKRVARLNEAREEALDKYLAGELTEKEYKKARHKSRPHPKKAKYEWRIEDLQKIIDDAEADLEAIERQIAILNAPKDKTSATYWAVSPEKRGAGARKRYYENLRLEEEIRAYGINILKQENEGSNCNTDGVSEPNTRSQEDGEE